MSHLVRSPRFIGPVALRESAGSSDVYTLETSATSWVVKYGATTLLRADKDLSNLFFGSNKVYHEGNPPPAGGVSDQLTLMSTRYTRFVQSSAGLSAFTDVDGSEISLFDYNITDPGQFAFKTFAISKKGMTFEGGPFCAQFTGDVIYKKFQCYTSDYKYYDLGTGEGSWFQIFSSREGLSLFQHTNPGGVKIAEKFEVRQDQVVSDVDLYVNTHRVYHEGFPPPGDVSLGMTLSAVNDPATPVAGKMALYAKSICGRIMPKFVGPSGLDSALQPALFGNTIFLISPNTSTSVSAVGGAVTSTGTLSTVSPAAGTFGLYTNFATSTTANSTAGTGTALAPFNLSNSIANAGGFTFVARLWLPDVSNIRFFAGLTSNALATEIASDNAAGSRIAFSVIAGETTIRVTTRNGSTANRVDTGMAFAANTLYDFYLFAPPGATAINWRVTNLSTGATVEGTVSATLPAATTFMRGGFQIATLTATARSVRMKKLYLETDL